MANQINKSSIQNASEQTLVELLERKNICYTNFNKICFDFLAMVNKGDISELESFQKKRESLLKVLEMLEGDVRVWLEGENSAYISEDTKTKVTALLNEKDSIVKSILNLDLQILNHIDRIKDDTIQKLQSVQTSKKTISAYKSPAEQIETAELKKNLTREA